MLVQRSPTGTINIFECRYILEGQHIVQKVGNGVTCEEENHR